MKAPRQVAACGALLSIIALACSELPVAPHGPSVLGVTGPSFNSAGAGPPLTGGGNYHIVDFQVISTRSAGTNGITEGMLTFEFVDGPLQGTFIQHQTSVCRDTGMCIFQIMEGNFTGTVAGCDGVDGFTYKGTVRAQLEPPPLTAEGSFTILASKPARDVVLAGGWTIEQVGLSGTYDARYVCK